MKLFIKSLIVPTLGIAAFSAFFFTAAVFEFDDQLLDTLDVKSPDPIHNPLLELPPRVFYEEALPIVKDHPNGKDCARLWSTGDPGSADCRNLANKIADHFGTIPYSVINPHVWTRYFVENNRAISLAIINS